MTELWREIPGFEGRYEVSDLGRVRTVARVIPYMDGRMRRVKQRIRSVHTDRSGYPAITLTKSTGKTTPRRVAVLVALAWIGPRPQGRVVCHNDGNKVNSRADNLRYDTPRENSLDVVRHGHHFWANQTHCKHGHELTPENVYTPPSRPGTRHCRTCTRRRLANLQARKKEAA